MRSLSTIVLVATLTVMVVLVTHFSILFPAVPDALASEACEIPAAAVSAETTAPVSAMGPDYIAPPPVIPVS